MQPVTVANEPHTFKVHYKATHLGTDTHANAGQEFPAVYTNQNFNRFIYYAGTSPWTNDSVSVELFPNLPAFSPMLYVPEHWGALVDSQNNGLTVYVPAQSPYIVGFASPDPGPGGPNDNATNYFSAQPALTLTPGFVFEGDLYIIAGSYVTAREIIYRLHGELAVTDIFAPMGATDRPLPGSTLTGVTAVSGWAFDDVSVASVEVLVDGVVNGIARYGLQRPDVSNDWPHAPVECGFSYDLDSSKLTNGPHTINVRVTDTSGNAALLPDIRIAAAN